MYILLLLFFPAIVAIAALLLKGEAAKKVALTGSLIELGLTIFVAGWLFPCCELSVDLPWIPSLGIGFSLNVDSVSLVLLLLTNILIPLIILSSFNNRLYSNNASFYSLVLFMQSALIGVFTAFDCFVFYIFWEAALIPVYFIAAIWGGENRIKVTFKFFIYTFLGSLFMLFGIIYLYIQTPAPHSFNFDIFSTVELNFGQEWWLFLCFFIAFAIKMPIFPFHTWQPNTYTESPTPASMLLAGIMLKMGIFGVIRWLIPLFPFAFNDFSFIIVTISVIGIIYASIIAIMQKDFKRLVAYSSIAHVGLISAGLFTGNIEGVQGAIIQMFNHGINVVGIFFILEIIAQRTNTRQIADLGGIVHSAPKLAICFVIIMLGSVALPLTNGFAGEFLLLMGVFKFNSVLGAVAGLTIILGAVYMLRMYKNIMLGEANKVTADFKDLTLSEMAVLIPICAIVIILGVYPNMILELTENMSMDIVRDLKENSLPAVNYLKF
jgi:NADH-quinone oxidoreductase subunit M